MTPEVASRASDWEIEDIGDDGEERGQIDQSRNEILNQLSLARSAFKHDDRAN